MIKQQVFLIVGGDLRQVYLSELLSQTNIVYVYGIDEQFELSKNITVIDNLDQISQKINYVILPIPASLDDKNVNCKNKVIPMSEILEKIDTTTLVFAGKVNHNLQIISKIYDIEVIDYLEREELSVLNSIPTAEGALQITMEEIPKTIFGLNCLITGFGRISKVLCKILVSMGANVTIAARKQSDLAWAKIYSAQTLHIKELPENIGFFDVIYNTVPTKILNKSILNKLSKNTLLIDLASKPGGVDFDVANSLGIKTIWALSLPGKVAPVTSGEIIHDTIINIIDERSGLLYE